MTNLPASSDPSAADETLAPTVKAKPPKPPKAPRRRASDQASAPGKPGGRLAGLRAALLNLLTLLLVLLSVVTVGLVVLLFQFPGVLAFVPGGSVYMPATDPPVAVALNTPIPTVASVSTGLGFPTLPPIWTPTNTPTVTPTSGPETPTPVPSETLAVPTYTPSSTTTPTPTPTLPTPTPSKPVFTQSRFAYNLQPGSPTYLSNFLNTSGCNWFGIVGRAFGVDSNPVINLTVHLEGGGLSVDTVTGSGPSALGPGGYQIPISDHPIDTTDVYKVQLRNNSGQPLSDVYSIRTYGDCPRNMVMVNFLQNH